MKHVSDQSTIISCTKNDPLTLHYSQDSLVDLKTFSLYSHLFFYCSKLTSQDIGNICNSEYPLQHLYFCTFHMHSMLLLFFWNQREARLTSIFFFLAFSPTNDQSLHITMQGLPRPFYSGQSKVCSIC